MRNFRIYKNRSISLILPPLRLLCVRLAHIFTMYLLAFSEDVASRVFCEYLSDTFLGNMIAIYTTHPDGVYQYPRWRVILSRTGGTLRIDVLLRPSSYLQDGNSTSIMPCRSPLFISMHIVRPNRTDVTVRHFNTAFLYPSPKQCKYWRLPCDLP